MLDCLGEPSKSLEDLGGRHVRDRKGDVVLEAERE